MKEIVRKSYIGLYFSSNNKKKVYFMFVFEIFRVQFYKNQKVLGVFGEFCVSRLYIFYSYFTVDFFFLFRNIDIGKVFLGNVVQCGRNYYVYRIFMCFCIFLVFLYLS